MKKVFVFIMGGLILCSAFAAGENTPTSKSYVDAAVAQKQDKISANITSVPTGYTQLRYIESTGTQWIDTGVVFNSNIGYELEYQPITTNNFVIQAGTTGQVIAQGGNIWEFRFNGSINRRPSPSEIDLTQFVNIKYNIDNKCSVDNRIVYIGDLTLNAGGSIRLFGPNYVSSGRMSFFLIYDNGVLVNNLVPVRRDSDNVVGMYDTISGRFFTNSGTGEFIAGPVGGAVNQVLTNTGTAGEYGTKGIYDATGAYATQQNNLVDAVTMNTAVQNAIDSEFQCIEWLDPNDHTSECLLLQLGNKISVPTGYTQLRYIESTGTQWIDTGIYINYDYEIFAILDPLSTGGFYYWGAAGNNSSDRTAWYTFWSVNSSGPSTWGGSRNTFYYRNLVPNSKNTVVQNKNGIWVNGTKTTSFSPVFDSRQAELTLYIFKTNPVSFDWNSGRIKLYELHVKNGNGRIVQNLVPARRDSDSVLGMYDTVTGTFFTNAGTGEFVAGPVLNLYLPSGN